MNAFIMIDCPMIVMFAFICVPIPLAAVAILFRRNKLAAALYGTSLGAFYVFSHLISSRFQS